MSFEYFLHKKRSALWSDICLPSTSWFVQCSNILMVHCLACEYSSNPHAASEVLNNFLRKEIQTCWTIFYDIFFLLTFFEKHSKRYHWRDFSDERVTKISFFKVFIYANASKAVEQLIEWQWEIMKMFEISNFLSEKKFEVHLSGIKWENVNKMLVLSVSQVPKKQLILIMF